MMIKIRNVVLFVYFFWAIASAYCGVLEKIEFADKTVSFEMSKPSSLTIQVLSDTNEFITWLYSGQFRQGRHQITWIGTDESGKAVKAGNYKLRFMVGKTWQRDKSFGNKGIIQFINPVDVKVGNRGGIYILDLMKKGETPRMYMFKANGKPFATEYFKISFACGSFTIDNENNFYICTTKGTSVYSKDGTLLRKMKAKPRLGCAVGADNVFYSREITGKRISIYDKESKLLHRFPEKKEDKKAQLFNLAPIKGLYVGPAMAGDKQGRIYLTDCFSCGAYKGAVVRYNFVNGKIEKQYTCQTPFKDAIGLCIGIDGMIYVTERGTVDRILPGAWEADKISKIYQLWDTGSSISVFDIFTAKDVQGLRSVAISHNNKDIYLLEDSANFGISIKNPEQSPREHRDLQGKGRLFKYSFIWQEIINKNIEVK